jgi:hypothetical protein
MKDDGSNPAQTIDGRELAAALEKGRELAAALSVLLEGLRLVPFSAGSEPSEMRQASVAALAHVIEYLRRVGGVAETAPLLHVAGALASLDQGMSSRLLQAPEKSAGKPPAGHEDEAARVYAAAAIDAFVEAGEPLAQAARRVANALRGSVPGVSTGEELLTLRETIRRNPKHWRHGAYWAAVSMARAHGDPNAFLEAVRRSTEIKPS